MMKASESEIKVNLNVSTNDEQNGHVNDHSSTSAAYVVAICCSTELGRARKLGCSWLSVCGRIDIWLRLYAWTCYLDLSGQEVELVGLPSES